MYPMYEEKEEDFNPPHGWEVRNICVTEGRIYFTIDHTNEETSIRGAIRDQRVFEDNLRGLHVRGIFEGDLQSGDHTYPIAIVFADTCGKIFERAKVIGDDFWAIDVCPAYMIIEDESGEEIVIVRDPATEWNPLEARCFGRIGLTLVAYCD